MPKKEGKYPCQYCGEPKQNPQARKSHERACPQNPNKASKTEVKKEGIEIHNPPGEETTEEKNPQLSPEAAEKLSKEDELLRQYPTIKALVKENEAMKRSLLDIDAQGRAIGQLTVNVNAIMDSIEKIGQLAARSPEITPSPQEKTKRNPAVNIEDALKASREADEKKKLDDDSSPEAGKMDELRKEAAQGQNAQTGQPQTSGTEIPPDIASLAGAPEWLQKAMMLGTVAEKFAPLLDKLRGVQPETAQTPEDMKTLNRIYENMQNIFSLSLRLTDGVRKETRKSIMDEITSSYSLVPKPGTPKPPETGEEE